MYKKGIYRIERNERLTETVWRMTLAGDTQWITAPGQFREHRADGQVPAAPDLGLRLG